MRTHDTRTARAARRGVTLLALTAALGVASCAGETAAGGVSVAMTWQDPPPAGTHLFASFTVQRRPDAATPGPVLASLPTQEIVAGEALAVRVPDVPYEGDLRLVMELRYAPGAEQRVAWYGISGRFELVAGATTPVAVEVQLARPRSDRGNVVALSFPGLAGAPGPNDLDAAVVTITSQAAAAIEVANNPTFDGATKLVTATDCAVGQDGEVSCQLAGWDLTAGAVEVEDGAYTVFARFIDAWGYPSPTVTAQTRVDLRPPSVLLARATPTYARPGAPIALTVTFDEAVAAPTLSVTPADVLQEQPPPTGDGYSWTWSARLNGDAEPGAVVGFSASFVDRAGNSTGPVTLFADAQETPLEIVVDAQAPQLTIEDFVIEGAGRERLGPDGRFYLRGGDALWMQLRIREDHELAGLLEAHVGIYDFICELTERRAPTAADPILTEIHECTLDIPPNSVSLADGQVFLTGVELDQAGNVGVLNGLPIELDRYPPILDHVTFSRDDAGPVSDPPTAGPNATLFATVTFDEPAVGDVRFELAEGSGNVISESNIVTTFGATTLTFTVGGPLRPGEYAMRVYAADRAGNADPAGISLGVVRWDPDGPLP
ncbi:MAG: hypothetical protein H6745_16545 [Deltaproteobacteria bacterium]|nr:hypothetical protein [Deltaproteobacteria bacterium]